MLEKLQYISLNDMVYQELKEKILSNELRPTEKLEVARLAGLLNVSRTPVVNALKMLEHEGYVTVHARSGSYVRQYSKEEIQNIFDFREVLELLVVKKSSQHLSPAVLASFRERFCKLLTASHKDKTLVETFFTVEVEFHYYLISLCPKVISDEFQNIIDLTKRLRRLHLLYMFATQPSHAFNRLEVQLHIDLVDALEKSDLARAEALIITDVSNTRDAILQSFEEIEAFAAGL